MSSTLETLNTVKRTFNIDVPKATIDEKIKARVQEVSQKANLAGFRPGKAPIEVVRKQFGASIRSEILTQLVEKSYAEALTEHNVKPVGLPKITIEEASFKDGDLKYKAEFEVFPEFAVKGLSEIELVKTKADITPKDLENMFENLRKQHISWKFSKGGAKEGDRVTIDFEGFKGKEAFAGGKAEDFKLILGSKTMIPGFEDGLIGKKAGEAFDLALRFPAEYHVEDLKDQAVTFKIKVKEVESPVLPEVDEAFVKLFEVESVEALQKEVRMNMERELDFALKAKLKDQVIEGLLKWNEVELPEALVKEEAERLAKVAAERMKSWGQKNVPEMPSTLFDADAKKRVALGLIMNRIIQDHNLKPDVERVNGMVEKMASIYDNPAQVVEFFRNNKARMAEIEQIVLEEQVVDQVALLAKVKEEVKSFDEVMKNNQAALANILPQG